MGEIASVTDRTGGVWFEITPDCWAEGDTFAAAAASQRCGDINSDWTLEQIKRVWGIQPDTAKEA